MIRVLVLTTPTLHHAYFVRELGMRVPDLRVFVETRVLNAPFPTAHPMEEARDAHEREVWFAGRDAKIADFAQTASFASMNDDDAVAAIKDAHPELIIVFGTGNLSQRVIGCLPDGILNLHGGDPEQYRGLDSHLWAIYHGDFQGLVTTLHRLTDDLDAGDIVGARPVKVVKSMPLHQLRCANTEVCLRLACDALDDYQAAGGIAARTQRSRGRYYSFMPAVLKDICIARFAKYTETLA